MCSFEFERDFSHEVLKTIALSHNYNLWVFNLIRPYIGKNILEVGCGTGNVTFFLTRYSNVTCLDKSALYIEHSKIDNPGVDFINADISDATVVKNLNRKFDTITCINVLEHVKDDALALENMKKLLDKKGRLILFVPALNSIFGSLDKQLEHYRRYNKRELSEKLKKSNLKVIDIFYSNFIGIFGWFINGRMLKRKKFSIIQPLVFDKLVPAIEKIEKIFKPPAGMSLLAVCENE